MYKLLLTIFFNLPFIINPQEISFTVNNPNLQVIISEIESQTELKFAFGDDVNTATNLVGKFSFEKENLGKVLNQLSKRTPFTLNIIGNNIAISVDPHVEKLESNKSKIQLLVVGNVTDAKGLPLPSVTVQERGTNNGVLTGFDGNFSIEVSSKESVLVFTYIGMQTSSRIVGDNSTMNVQLEEDSQELDDVIVIGYGSLSKRNISGSIVNIKEENFNKGATQTVADLLQGRVAGLAITTESGDVTAEQTMRLRGTSSLTGSSSPFVVIDGIPGMDLNSVAPQDIESISVLKDASSVAIYGSRAASGVILITTKKGKTGQTNVQYNTYLAMDIPSSKPELLSAAQWREYTKDMDVVGLDLGANTNWFDEIMRTGFSQNHNLSVSGGLEDGNYRASLNYLDREGIMKDNQIERYNLLFSLNKKTLNDHLSISLSGGSVLSNYSPTNEYNTVLAYNMLPVYPVRNEDGSWFSIQEFDQGNPAHNIAENKNLFKTGLIYGNVKTELEVISGLKASVNLFKQRKTSDNSRYNAITTPAGRQDRGNAFRGNEVWDKDLMELTIDYSTEINRHDLSLLGGYSYEYNEYQSVGASNRTFISDRFTYNNLGAGENLFPSDVNSYKNMDKLISIFGRLNYIFNDKYILTGTLRRDGSSKFGKNHKWGTFPSISGAWRISDEPFLIDSNLTNILDDLKLRVGYGVVGNQSGIDPYTSIALYSRSDQFFENGNWRNTYKYAQNDNPDLKWEETASLNIGLDFSFFNSRFRGSFDYYIKKTNDLLYVYNVPVPPYLYPTMLANVGDISNKGFEIDLSGDIIKNKNFLWSSTFNFAHNKNVIEKLSNELFQTDNIRVGYIPLRGSGSLTSHILEEGQELGTFYNLRSNGLDENGKFIIEDINQDGIINTLDYTYIGNAMPKFTYGIYNSFTYKNFDLTFFLRGVYGNDVINNPRVQYSNPKWLPGGNVLEEVLTNGITDDPLFSSYFVEKGSFLRMDNLSLAYNINFLEKIGMKNMKIYGTAQNLFIITKFKGADPEVQMSGLDPGKLEHSFIPKPRTYSIGLEFNF